MLGNFYYDVSLAIGLCFIIGIIWIVKQIMTAIIKKQLHGSILSKEEMEIYTKINNKLIQILIGTESDRAYIWLFHNGTYFAKNISRQKMSCYFEQVRDGVSTEMENFKDIDVTTPFLWQWIQLLSSSESKILPYGVTHLRNKPNCLKCPIGKNVIHVSVDLIESGQSKAILTQQGIYSMINTPILDSSKNMVGILGVDFCNDVNTYNFPQCDLCNETDAIALLLDKLDRSKKNVITVIKNLITG